MTVPANTPSGRQYWRCVNNGQWQNAANIRGVSVDQVRRDHDTLYAPVQAVTEPHEDWRVIVVRRLFRLKLSRRAFAVRVGRSYTSIDQYLSAVHREPSDEWLARLFRDLREVELEEGEKCSL